MSSLAISEGKLYTITQVLLSCANDIMAVNAIEYDNPHKPSVDLLKNGFKRPTIEDVFRYIENSEKSFSFDWTIADNSLDSHGYITMDRYIDVRGEELGVRICLHYALEADSIKFTATSNDTNNGDDCEYQLSLQDKVEAIKAVNSVIAEIENLCSASDITIDIERELQFS